MSEQVKLLGTWASAFNCRVTWALKLKGITYEYIEEDLSNKSTLLLHSNPVHKKIPVLLHHDKPICESMVIIEYIEETWPQNPLLPTHPIERANARFWVKYVEDKGIDVLRRTFRTTGKELAEAVRECFEVLKTVEQHCLGDKKYLDGGKIGMVDIAFGSMVYWLSVNEDVIGVKLIPPHKFPSLHKWFQRFLEDTVIRENIPDHDKLVGFFKARRQALEASAS